MPGLVVRRQVLVFSCCGSSSLLHIELLAEYSLSGASVLQEAEMGPTCAGDILWAVSAVHLKIAVTSCTVRMKIEHYATLGIMCVIHGPVTPCENLT